jgi:cysteine sulfinate desulfinase/cysteine desulfurase-like protein
MKKVILLAFAFALVAVTTVNAQEPQKKEVKKDEACLKGVIRISLSASITKEDIDRLISTIRNGIKEYAR